MALFIEMFSSYVSKLILPLRVVDDDGAVLDQLLDEKYLGAMYFALGK